MTHIRRSILKEIREQIKASPVFAGVWIQRIPPVRIAFPSVTLYAETEVIDYLIINNIPRQQERKLTVAVAAWIKGTPDDEKAESDMDAAALIIEELVHRPELANECVLVGIDFQVAENDPEIHIVTLTYQVSYFCIEFEPRI